MNITDELIHSAVMTILLPLLVTFAGIVGYAYFVRPMLQQNPAFKELYATEETALSAVAAKLSGLKQKLATIFISAVGFVVVAHDSLASLLQAAGIDPVAYGSQLLPKVPSLAWPIITLACLWIIQYFRGLADKQARANAEALLNAGHTLAAPAPGLPMNTLPSPSPLGPLGPLPDKVG
jgi:hypothetical protein